MTPDDEPVADHVRPPDAGHRGGAADELGLGTARQSILLEDEREKLYCGVLSADLRRTTSRFRSHWRSK